MPFLYRDSAPVARIRGSPVFPPVVLLWQLPNFDNLAEEHDPSFIKWLRDDGDLVVTHIGRSGPYMAINCAILLTIGDDGVVESFRKGPVSNYVDKLGKLTWVNCCLKISVQDFDKVVGWRRDRRWVYVLSIPTPIHIVVAHTSTHPPAVTGSIWL